MEDFFSVGECLFTWFHKIPEIIKSMKVWISKFTNSLSLPPAYQQSEDLSDLEFAFFGIFDGHGGAEAAKFAKEHLMNNILAQKGFYSDDDDEVLKAIKEGYISTHLAMWKNLGKSLWIHQ